MDGCGWSRCGAPDPDGWSLLGGAPVTSSSPPSDRDSGSGTVSDFQTQQGADHERAECRGRDEDQGDQPGRPPWQDDRLAPRAIRLDASGPLQPDPELTLRQSPRFG